MDIKHELFSLMQDKNISIEKLAELMSDDKKVYPNTLQKKLDTRKIHFKEVQKILNILGYKIKITKKQQNF